MVEQTAVNMTCAQTGIRTQTHLHALKTKHQTDEMLPLVFTAQSCQLPS